MSGRSPMPLRDAACEVAAALAAAGHVAYFAGGCVRDREMGRDPEDYDIATSASPDEIRAVFPKARGVGEAFGVMLVRHGGRVFEVATFREDFAYRDGRRPEGVRFSDDRRDAQRRDFTVNGLFENPATGAIIDHVGGRADVAARIVRAIGDPHERIREDRLRMLRAARFAARLGFDVDPATADAIRAHASELGSVSAERVGDEVRRMLGHPNRRRAAELIEDFGLDPAVFGERVRPHAWKRLSGLPVDAEAATALAAWWLDRVADVAEGEAGGEVGVEVGVEARERVRQTLRTKLCLSNADAEHFSALLLCRERLLAVASEPVVGDRPSGFGRAARVRLAASPGFDPALAVVAGEAPEVARVWREQADRECPDRRLPVPLVDGNDLIRAGLRPGPEFRPILDAALDRQIEAGFADRAEALRFALALASGGT